MWIILGKGLMFRARIAKLFIKLKWGLIFCSEGNVWTSRMSSVMLGSKNQSDLTSNSWWYLEKIFWPELILFYLTKLSCGFWLVFFFSLFTFILNNATICLERQFLVSYEREKHNMKRVYSLTVQLLLTHMSSF